MQRAVVNTCTEIESFTDEQYESMIGAEKMKDVNF